MKFKIFALSDLKSFTHFERFLTIHVSDCVILLSALFTNHSVGQKNKRPKKTVLSLFLFCCDRSTKELKR